MGNGVKTISSIIITSTTQNTRDTMPMIHPQPISGMTLIPLVETTGTTILE